MPQLGNALNRGGNWILNLGKFAGIPENFIHQFGFYDESPSNIVLEDKNGKVIVDADGDIKIFTPEEAAAYQMSKTALPAQIREWTQNVTNGVEMTEEEMDWLDRSAYGAVMFGLNFVPGFSINKN